VSAEVLPEDVRGVDAAVLAPIVGAALGRDVARVGSWRVERIGGGAPRASGGIFRFVGTALEGVEEVGWSVVLKAVTRGDHERRTEGDASDPRNLHYAPREWLAFASGLLEELPGLAAPRCFGAEEREDGGCWLWLEDVPEAGSARWPIGRYARAARHVGEMNGAYAEERRDDDGRPRGRRARPIPEYPWLSSGYVPYLRTRLARRPWEEKTAEAETWEHPAVRRLFPAPLHERVAAFLARRAGLVEALATLPETLCHNDAFRRNLIGTGGEDGYERTVAIDWEYFGRGPIGLEAGQLVSSSMLFGDADAAECRELDAAVFESYLDGMRAAGWRGDPRDARLGYCAFAAAYWGVGALNTAIHAVTSEDPSTRTNLEGWLRMPLERVAEQMAGLGRYLLELGDEAAALSGA
jgi:hypothetical protein